MDRTRPGSTIKLEFPLSNTVDGDPAKTIRPARPVVGFGQTWSLLKATVDIVPFSVIPFPRHGCGRINVSCTTAVISHITAQNSLRKVADRVRWLLAVGKGIPDVADRVLAIPLHAIEYCISDRGALAPIADGGLRHNDFGQIRNVIVGVPGGLVFGRDDGACASAQTQTDDSPSQTPGY